MFRILSKYTCKLPTCKIRLRHFPSEMYSKLVSPVFTSDLHVQIISDVLSNYGFNPGQIGRILKSPHNVLSLSKTELLSNLTSWLHFDVKDKIFTVLSAYPELLTLNPDFVNARFTEMMTLFTKKDINKLLVTCPYVFLDEFTDIYNKVQYIVTKMGVEQKSIVKCQALQFDLHHIKSRHVFMTRAGCFMVNKKAVKSKNAPLNKIFSRNIETFLKLTDLTEEEYNVFSETIKEEIDLLNEELDDEL